MAHPPHATNSSLERDWPVQPVELDDIEEIARRLGIVIDDADAALAPEWIERTRRLVGSLDSVSVDRDDRVGSRTYRWATRSEDPLNAFITFCSVAGRSDGRLHGLRVAIKDCIAVAGVPLTDGGGRQPYPVPSRDAVVVERLLNSGAEIVGKTNMEDMASGSGIGSHFGPTKNPRNPKFQSGGSSSGSAAAVGGGLADVALGTDQGGSVRIPAAWCGLVGMKPTHGLVPTEGMSRLDPTMDHIGPITWDVTTNARVFACLTESRGHAPPSGAFESSPLSLSTVIENGDGGINEGTRLGLVTQSTHDVPLSDDLRRAFEAGISTLRRLGATIQEADVPLWSLAYPILNGVMAQGLLGTWMGGGLGFGIAEALDEELVRQAPSRSHLRSTALPPRVLARLLFATYAQRYLGGEPIMRALNLRVALAQQIDACFEQFDLLVTPTVCKVAEPLPDATPSRESLGPGVFGDLLLNTAPLDLSGHPALTLPCGVADDDLPVGLQIIGPYCGEVNVYQLALALERALS